MFTTLAAFTRTVRKLIFPLGRTAIALLLWTNRHTLALWFRSFRDEIQTNGVVPERLRHLATGLWAIANDRRTANAEPLKTLWVRDDGYEFAAHDDWAARSVVEDLLGPIGPHETSVSAA
ncbi:MAG: hypothetical protein CL424_16345 [Acidimicrobiaceae bacterium]|nr:hypothetical protein [Acidimicrobiaceae bacterium]